MRSKLLRKIITDFPNLSELVTQPKIMKEIGQALFSDVDAATELQDDLCNALLSEEEELLRITLLNLALVAARFDIEKGRKKGELFISKLASELKMSIGSKKLDLDAALAISGTWSRTGINPPECLEYSVISTTDLPASDGGIISAPISTFEPILERISVDECQNAAELLAVIGALLPVIPKELRTSLVRAIAARPGAPSGAAAVALLLMQDMFIVAGALAGLRDRIGLGLFSQNLLKRLTIIRTWVVSPDTRQHIDFLIRGAIKYGHIESENWEEQSEIIRVSSSLVDANGRHTVTALVKRKAYYCNVLIHFRLGHGATDANVTNLGSEEMEKSIFESVEGFMDGIEISPYLLRELISFSLGDSLTEGKTPPANLVDIVELLGFKELRPSTSELAEVLFRTDAASFIGNISAQQREDLLKASENWPYNFIAHKGWYEDSESFFESNRDLLVSLLDKRRVVSKVDELLWQRLESKREHWLKIFSLNGVLLDSHQHPAANEFVAVSQAISCGRNLEEIPIMIYIHTYSKESILHYLNALKHGSY